jgi:5-methylcytosine-specific restriction endonuclease McrA
MRPKRTKLSTLKPRIATLDVRIGKPTVKVAEPFYSSAPWRNLMKGIIAERGWRCEDVECPTPHGPWSKIYGDHIVEIRDGGAKLDPANVLLRCPVCHGRKTAQEREKRLLAEQ